MILRLTLPCQDNPRGSSFIAGSRLGCGESAMFAHSNDWVSQRQSGPQVADLAAVDPRLEMARRLPPCLQGFLTWLTAMPAEEEAAGETTALRHLAAAF